MESLRVYYHLPSQDSYLSYEDSFVTDDIEVVDKYISKLRNKEDSISLSYGVSGVKCKVWQAANGVDFVFEIISTNGIVFKELDRESFLGLLDKVFDILKKPEEFDFQLESL